MVETQFLSENGHSTRICNSRHHNIAYSSYTDSSEIFKGPELNLEQNEMAGSHEAGTSRYNHILFFPFQNEKIFYKKGGNLCAVGSTGSPEAPTLIAQKKGGKKHVKTDYSTFATQ